MNTRNPFILACIIVLFQLTGALFAFAQEETQPCCIDTHYGDNSEANFLKSNIHLMQLFGETSFRRTNFFNQCYHGTSSWMETRLFFPRLSSLSVGKKNQLPFPDLYATGLLKGQKDLDWEDRLDYGLGLEWRPFRNFDFSKAPAFAWLYHVRFYATYWRTNFLHESQNENWRPGDDFRTGIELYRECNLYNGADRRFWGEVWSDFSWRKSNFVVKDFETWTFAIVPKWGVKIFPEKVSLMPYVTTELSATGRETEFWQNRILLGAGIRLMPFRKMEGMGSLFLKGMRIFAEGHWVAAYLNDQAPDDTPDYDFRIGVTYVINRW